MDLRRTLRELGHDLLALVWPTECVNCGRADRDCCDPCLAEVRAHSPPIERDVGLTCFAATTYDGAVRALLVALKHAGRMGFARVLGPRLRAPLAEAMGRVEGPQAPIIVTAPSRASRVRQRGYRHVDLLVAAALRGQRLRVLRLRALKARRGRSAQVGLDAAERERNARRIAVRRGLRTLISGREVIIVDDVVTTGATLRAAREALESAGAAVVAAVVLCDVVRWDGKSDQI
ncbi:MAG: phosphoribosyltransferase family protein [Leucobacter sp.]